MECFLGMSNVRPDTDLIIHILMDGGYVCCISIYDDVAKTLVYGLFFPLLSKSSSPVKPLVSSTPIEGAIDLAETTIVTKNYQM